jgi:hypothetical protein
VTTSDATTLCPDLTFLSSVEEEPNATIAQQQGSMYVRWMDSEQSVQTVRGPLWCSHREVLPQEAGSGGMGTVQEPTGGECPPLKPLPSNSSDNMTVDTSVCVCVRVCARMEYDSVYFIRSLPTFWRNVVPQSSRSNAKHNW